MEIDIGRLTRQEQVVDKMMKVDGGTLEAATGFGKSYTGILLIQRMMCEGFTALVVVPTRPLKKQWKELLKSFKLDVEVEVINTAYKNKYDVDLVIFDEAHRIPAPEFSKVLDTVKYKKVFGLTATVIRSDGEEWKLLEVAPIIDTISVRECVKNGWISEFTIYNLAVPFTSLELKAYKKVNSSFKFASLKCGYGGAAFSNAMSWLKNGSREQKKWAGIYMGSVSKRKKLLQGNDNKVKYAKKIVDHLSDRKGLIFSETVETAKDITNLIGKECATYYGQLGKKERIAVLKKLTDGRSKVRLISAVKALNEGLDVPACSLAIIVAGNSIERDQIQRMGRVLRVSDKQSIIVNLYIQGTQDEVWLRDRLSGLPCKWITKIDEIE